MKKLKVVLISILLLFVLVLAAGWIYLKHTAPKYKGEITLAALEQAVQITYDKFGVPYIHAQNAHDAYYALGYAHAQERLFQMEMIRRLSSGQLSEILGPDLVGVDKSMLALGIRDMGERSAKKYFSQIDAPFKENTLAYLEGINAFIDKDILPIEFTLIGFKPKHFVPADVYTTIGYMSLTFSSALSQDPLDSQLKEKLGNAYMVDLGFDTANYSNTVNSNDQVILAAIQKSYEKVNELLPMPVWEASNNWAISPKRSKSGKVLLANDTHIAYAQPSVWYEAVLNYPGFTMAGYYLAGVPYAVMGHNQNIGWGLTIFPFDNMDLYREKVNPKNPDQYWATDHWENFGTKSYSIAVKGAETIDYKVRITRHGPVLNDVYPDVAIYANAPIALWWALHTMESEAVEALYLFNNANNITEFEQGIPKVDLLGLNIMYGDVDDNIAWWGTGKLPERPAHVNPLFVLDGASGNDDVLGFYPSNINPKSINPEQGFLVTSNNAPPSQNGITIPGYYFPGLRAERIETMITDEPKWDVSSMQEIQNDTYGARDYMLVQDVILPLLNNPKNDKSYEEVKNALAKWDGSNDTKSAGAVIYNQFLYFALHDLTADETGEELFPKFLNSLLLKSSIEKIFTNPESAWWDNINTTDYIESRKDIIELAFEETVGALEVQLGTNISNWQWGKVHTLTHVHPIGRKAPFDKVFNVGPFEKSGSNEVVDKEGFAYNSEGVYPVKSGPAMRLLLDFAEANEALSIIPTGQSGNIMSPHYADQAEMFIDGQYKTIHLNANQFKNKDVVVLKPE